MGLIRELMFFGLAVLRGMLILVIYDGIRIFRRVLPHGAGGCVVLVSVCITCFSADLQGERRGAQGLCAGCGGSWNVCLSSDSQHLAGGTHCVDFKWMSGDHLQAGAGSWWKIL